MKIEIKEISREKIIPSFPTLVHLKKYKISFLDQIMSHALMTLVFFYPSTDNNNRISKSEISNGHLKKSLSKALSMFYPLAGRLVGNSYVNCNDEGVSYVEAQASCNLSDFLTNPIQEEVEKFQPCILLDDDDDSSDICLAVQTTFFNCGGFAIGIGFSHKVVDGVSIFKFVNSWAAISRGDENCIQSPIFESATLFPPRDLSRDFFVKDGSKEHFVNKRFLFTAEKISLLRDKYTNNTVGRPTRTEALSVFVWTRFMVATGGLAKGKTNKKVYVLLHYVDIRTRVIPPLSENHFGNLILRSIAVVPSLENKDGQSTKTTFGLVKKIRDAIRDVDPYSIAKIPEGDESLDEFKINGQVKMELEGKVDVFRFSSICRQPVYESDFGWGKPVWVALGRIHTCKMVHFMDSLSGGHIYAMVNIKEEDMTKFQADEELCRYIETKHIQKEVEHRCQGHSVSRL